MRHVLTEVVGVRPDLGPSAYECELCAGDILLMCSDGLHGLVKEDEMLEVAQQPIDRAADDFVKRVLERGAPDNVTVIVARAIRAEPGDDDPTLLDHKQADKTQEMTAADVASVDESGREAAVENSPVAPAPRPGPSTPLGMTAVRWLLIVVVLAGVAGAWFFWNR